MAKPPEPNKEQSTSSQDVWAPQGEALQNLYNNAADWQTNNQGNLDTLSQQSQNYAQGALESVAPAWLQQLQGGASGGYDVAGGLNNMIGQNNNVNAQQYNAAMGNANTVGPVTQSHAYDLYNQNVGPGGSLANMEGMYRRQANSARGDMLGSMDARAAASGMGGGSAHGNAIGRGMEGINTNLQNQMATTGYDAYNKDLDRQLGIGAQADQYNQQRAMGDQNALNQFASNNQQALNQSMQNNQQADLAAQQGNQQFATNQQQMMSGLLDQQNQATSGAIGQQGDVQNFINGPLQGFMNSTAGMQFMSQMLGNPVATTQQQRTSNDGRGSGSFNVGGVGGAWG